MNQYSSLNKIQNTTNHLWSAKQLVTGHAYKSNPYGSVFGQQKSNAQTSDISGLKTLSALENGDTANKNISTMSKYNSQRSFNSIMPKSVTKVATKITNYMR